MQGLSTQYFVDSDKIKLKRHELEKFVLFQCHSLKEFQSPERWFLFFQIHG